MAVCGRAVKRLVAAVCVFILLVSENTCSALSKLVIHSSAVQSSVCSFIAALMLVVVSVGLELEPNPISKTHPILLVFRGLRGCSICECFIHRRIRKKLINDRKLQIWLRPTLQIWSVSGVLSDVTITTTMMAIVSPNAFPRLQDLQILLIFS